MKDSKVLKRNPNFVSRTIEDETILLPIYRTSDEIDCIYTLNDAASRVWHLIDGKRSLVKIKETLLEEFDVTKKEIDRNLSALLKDLTEIKAVR